jgi:5-methylcytosine-specific restriction protein B
MSDSDDIRKFAVDWYVNPARQKGLTRVVIRAGDVHKALDFANRSALVCGALGTNIFKAQCGAKSVSREGPGVGMSTKFILEF